MSFEEVNRENENIEMVMIYCESIYKIFIKLTKNNDLSKFLRKKINNSKRFLIKY